MSRRFFSNQRIYCNACGKEMHMPFPAVLGYKYKVCSKECDEEIIWRETLSIMGKEYYLKRTKE